MELETYSEYTKSDEGKTVKAKLCPDFPVFVNDWLSSTAISSMSPAEEGGYFRLLCYAWNETDCTLPDSDDDLATLSRLGSVWKTGSGAKIRMKFIPDPDHPGRLYNPRQREERQKQLERVSAASEQRKNAAKKRWDKTIRPQYGRNAAASSPHYDRNSAALSPQCGRNASSPVSLHSNVLTNPERISLEKELAKLTSRLEGLEADRSAWNTPEWARDKQNCSQRRQEILNRLGRVA